MDWYWTRSSIWSSVPNGQKNKHFFDTENYFENRILETERWSTEQIENSQYCSDEILIYTAPLVRVVHAARNTLTSVAAMSFWTTVHYRKRKDQIHQACDGVRVLGLLAFLGLLLAVILPLCLVFLFHIWTTWWVAAGLQPFLQVRLVFRCGWLTSTIRAVMLSVMDFPLSAFQKCWSGTFATTLLQISGRDSEDFRCSSFVFTSSRWRHMHVVRSIWNERPSLKQMANWRYLPGVVHWGFHVVLPRVQGINEWRPLKRKRKGFALKTEQFAFASLSKAKAKPRRPTSTCSSKKTIPILEPVWIDIEPGAQFDQAYQWQKE